MAKTKNHPRPNDGGSYKRNEDGSYTRLDTPQKPDPGKTVRRKRAAANASKKASKKKASKKKASKKKASKKAASKATATKPAASNSPASTSQEASNVRNLHEPKE